MNISVVIPSLNSEKDIERCLITLKPQLSQGDEIIIVDGGSRDETLRIAHDYGCKIFIYPEANLGEARNFGVSQSGNEIILQTDTDVAFPRGFINILRRYYEQNPEILGVSGGWRDGKGRLLADFTCAILEGAFKYADCIQSYRREIYYQTQGHPKVSFGEQIGLWIQIQRMGPTIYDPNLYVYHYSNRPAQIPSYMIGLGLLGAGLAYENAIGGSTGYGIMGAGAGFTLGQIGVDLGINADAPPNHFHHWMLGLMIIAGTLAFSDTIPDDLEMGLYGFGSGLFLQDVLTEPTVATVPILGKEKGELPRKSR